VGPPEGFAIEDETAQWEDFIFGFIEFAPYLALVKICVYLRVRLAFDTPQMGYLVKALEDQIAEHEKRLSNAREAVQWVDPEDSDPVVVPTSRILDGGDAG
jgi:hypothetical protein